jgi:hypothetical protein
MASAFIFAAVLLTGATASAQDHGPVGLTTGFPNAVGVIWHVTERLAIAPRLTISRNSSEGTFTTTSTFTPNVIVTTTSTSTSEAWTLSPALNLQFYLARWDEVATYLTGGGSYFRNNVTTTTEFETPNFSNLVGVINFTRRTEVEENKTDGFGVNGGFGVQYTPHRRFAVFGEVGVRYASQDSVSDRAPAATTYSNSAVSNASVIGIILYF